MLKFKVLSLLLACLVLFGFALPVLAAENSIIVNPVILPFGFYHLDYEVSVSEKSSYNVMLIYYDDDNFSNSLAEAISEALGGSEEDKFSYTYGCKIGKRWYAKSAQKGWYYGLKGSYTESDGEKDSYQFSAGGCFGKRRIIDSGFTYDFGVNVAYYKDSEEDSGWSVFISTHIGYGW